MKRFSVHSCLIIFGVVIVVACSNRLPEKKGSIRVPLEREYDVPEHPDFISLTKNSTSGSVENYYHRESSELNLMHLNSDLISGQISLPASGEVQVKGFGPNGEEWRIPIAANDMPVLCYLTNQLDIEIVTQQFLSRLKSEEFRVFMNLDEEAFETKHTKSVFREFIAWKFSGTRRLSYFSIKLKSFDLPPNKWQLQHLTCAHTGAGMHNTFNLVTQKVVEQILL